MNLILLEPHEITDAGDVHLSDGRAAHLLRVLHAAPGHQVRVGVLDGPLGTGIVISTTERTVTLRCVFESDVPQRPRVDLLLALPRPKVMRRLWAQIAALGAGRIILTNAERVERNYFDTHILTPACYRPLLIEGLQQARDTRLPRVSVHRQFKVLIEDDLNVIFDDGLRLLADPGTTTSIRERVKPADGRRVLIAVGPEGGWNDFERALLRAHGFHAVGLGSRTLRTDTACIALLALLHEAADRVLG